MMQALLLSVAILVMTYLAARKLIESFRISGLANKPVLITGCDSGFGHALALKCLSAGMPVFAACLTQQGTEQLESEANKNFAELASKRLITFVLNVTSAQSVENAKTLVEKEITDRGYNGLHALVNNAGVVGNSCWDDWLTPDDYESVWRVNALGVIRVTHAFKSLIKRARGRVVNTASVCGRVSLPGLGPYSVSKHAVESYTDTIRLEMGQFGVRVCLLEPGFFKTPLTDAQRQTQMVEALWRRTSDDTRREYGESFFQYTLAEVHKNLRFSSDQPELVVNAYFHAMTSVLPRARYYIGRDCIFGFVPFSLLPTQLQDWAFWTLGKLIKTPKPQAMSF